MIRGIITSVTEGEIKKFGAAGRPGETFLNREYFQHYGFTSRPLSGAEGIIIKEGNHIIMVASDDRRYRIALENGEVCLYTDEGDFIHLKRNKNIHISTGNKLLVDATEDVEINTKRAVVNASESAIVNTAVLEANATTSATITTPVLQATATTSANITTPQLVAEASVSIELSAPLITLKADAIGMQAYGAGVAEATLTGNMNFEGNVTIEGEVEITGPLDVTGDINATGDIIDGGANTNHHTHT